MPSMTTRLDSRYIINPAASSSAELTATLAELNAVADASAGNGFRSKTVDISVLTTAETTLLTLPVGAIVQDVIVNIVNASAEAETIDIGTAGTSNDPNGFTAALVTNAVGIYSMRDGNANAVTIGLNETFRTGANFTGTLLTKAYLAGSDAAEDTGIYVPKPWFVATADPVTYTLSGTITSFAGTITVQYLDVSGFDVA
jgi:hypothetical protein